MSLETHFEELKTKGYTIIPNVLNNQEVEEAKAMFYNWQKTIMNHDNFHNNYDSHGIYKYHEVGHQEHAWFIRTRPNVINIFKKLWNTDDLIVSFDGSCYIPKKCNKKNKSWTHTDQSPLKKGVHCYQGLVSLTENKERTLIVYEQSHLIHEHYFMLIGQENEKKDWQLIDPEFLGEIAEYKRVLHVPAGALVLWDSRTFHENQYGNANSEERIVQYVCYLPKNVETNTNKMQEKRLKYFQEKRTTSHWPSPICVNGLQPHTYGNKEDQIDYSLLKQPNLEKYKETIMQLI